MDERGDLAAVLLDAATIRAGVTRVAGEIARDHPGDPPVLVGVLKSALVFMADLVRLVEGPLVVDFVSLVGYDAAAGGRRLRKDLDTDLAGRDVIVVTGIIETGATAAWLLEHLKTRGPRSLAVCAFVTTRGRRRVELPLAYLGFELPAAPLVGYGLDYRERYRNLPVVGVLGDRVLARMTPLG